MFVDLQIVICRVGVERAAILTTELLQCAEARQGLVGEFLVDVLRGEAIATAPGNRFPSHGRADFSTVGSAAGSSELKLFGVPAQKSDRRAP